MIQKEEKTPNQPLFVDKGGGTVSLGKGFGSKGK